MVDPPAPGKELRYRDVSIHSQGKTEHGTLYLLRHHACFSYYPGAKRGNKGAAHSRNASGPGKVHDNTPPSHATQHSSSDGADSEATSQPPSQPSAAKVRPKDIWIPYPMVGSCLLRPSHAASIVARPSAQDESSSDSHNGEDLFPPTFGTSAYERPSTDSARLAPFSTPPRPSTPLQAPEPVATPESARQPVIRIRRKDFQMMALHFNSGEAGASADEVARQAFYVLRDRCCINKIQSLHAFHYQPHKDEVRASAAYDARREFARMGISPKAADGPGTAWRISDINQDYSFSRTYPSVLCVPKAVSDNMLKYGGGFRSKCRIPCLTYLHSNGGSISRSSQPMTGMQNKRNPQDERLVQAIFSSHIPSLQTSEDEPPHESSLTSPSSSELGSSTTAKPDLDGDAPSLPVSQSETALDDDPKTKSAAPRVYGSTRQNLIVDARPALNVHMNKVTGGGIEDVANYRGTSLVPVEKVLLDIANIHIMRKSLDKVIDSFGSADYVDMKPNQETLRKSGWLGHIRGLMDGAETVARVVGLGGSHVLVHCSDGWDRTAQVAALAQVMMDPHCRTLAGFITLVQKDFLSFGHKFRDRNGIEGSEKWFKIENDRVVPSRAQENGGSDPSGLNVMGQKALRGARQWFEKNKGNFFNQPNSSGENVADTPNSRPASPPPNPIIHSPPSTTTTDGKEHKMNEGEVSPVFHQFLDTVFQLLHQQPQAFEFNERFLRRLFYHAYACQYGEFLFNNEKDRAAQPRLPSVWGHFLSRRPEFTNPAYVPQVDDPLLFPRKQGAERETEVRWWAGLFGRKDEDMNLPRALAPVDPAPPPARLRPSVSFEEPSAVEGGKEESVRGEGAVKETRSTPSLAAVRDSLTNSFSSMTFRQTVDAKESAPGVDVAGDVPPAPAAATEEHVVPERQQDHPPAAPQTSTFDTMDMDEGDPLGVSSSAPRKIDSGGGGRGLDFAAFASQNAFRER